MIFKLVQRVLPHITLIWIESLQSVTAEKWHPAPKPPTFIRSQGIQFTDLMCQYTALFRGWRAHRSRHPRLRVAPFTSDTPPSNRIKFRAFSVCQTSKMSTEKPSESGLVQTVTIKCERTPVRLHWYQCLITIQVVLFLHFALEKSFS